MENTKEKNIAPLNHAELIAIDGGVVEGGCILLPDLLKPTTGPYNPATEPTL